MPVRLHYSVRFTLVLALIGVFSLWRSISGVHYTDTPSLIQLVLGIMATLVAVLSVLVPCADVDARITIIYGFIPLFKREFHYQSLYDLMLDDNQLYCQDEAGWHRIAYRAFIRPEDWAMLEKSVPRT